MNKKTEILFFIFASFASVLFALLLYLNSNNSINKEKLKRKTDFLQVVRLPDLAISTEANYVRHRSLTDIFSIFRESPELIEYFPSTFSINFAKHIVRQR